MKKEDLNCGNVVELRDGSRYIKTCIEEYGFIILVKKLDIKLC